MKLALALAVVLAVCIPVSGQHGQSPLAGDRGMGVQILSDTQGVDFTDYIRKLLVTVQRNWEHAMPESARMGDYGVVFISFQINPDGSVRAPDPTLERSSGEKALDDAAMVAIHASSPFKSLPSKFHGP